MEQEKTNRAGGQVPDGASLKTAASLDTEKFLSFEDFWQQQAAGIRPRPW
jgi:hypothetical protein